VEEGIHAKTKLILRLLNANIDLIAKKQGALTGKSFCFTGEISIRRGDAMRLVQQKGGEVKSSVSKGLTYLVQANKNSVSTKTQKARKYGTKVINESEFFEIVNFSFKDLAETR
jgi:DNA ligase (NAD+)